VSASGHYLLGASALRALILEEPGTDRVQELLDEVLVVNLGRGGAKAVREGRFQKGEVFAIVDGLKLEPEGDQFGRPWPADRRRVHPECGRRSESARSPAV